MDYSNYHYVSIEEYLANEQAIIDGTYMIDKIGDTDDLKIQTLVFEKHNDMVKYFEENESKQSIDYNINVIEVGSQVINKTKHLMDRINLKYHSFRHSKSNQYYMFGEDFGATEKLCEILSQHSDYEKYLNFKFNNQTVAGISGALKAIEMDNFEEWESSFNLELRDKLDKYSIKPINHAYTNNYSDIYDEMDTEFENIDDILPYNLAKLPINAWTGLFNKKYKSEDTAMVSQSVPFIIGMINYFNENQTHTDLKLQQVGDNWWLRLIESTRVESDTSIIYSYILGAGYLSLYNMAKDIMNDNLKIVGIKTDSLQIISENDDVNIDNYLNAKIKSPEWDETKPISLTEIAKYLYKLEADKQVPYMREDIKNQIDIKLKRLSIIVKMIFIPSVFVGLSVQYYHSR